MDFLLEVAGFAIKVIAVAIAVAMVMSLIIAQVKRKGSHPFGYLQITSLSDHFSNLQQGLKQAMLPKKAYKAEMKARKKLKTEPLQKRVFVMDFSGDIAATAVADLREQVTGLLTVASKEDEVVVRLESPGGIVSNYGLAASQLVRLREAEIPITVCIDKVAASGGYLMAAVANKIVAAPFAAVGSIGVLAMIPNFHRLLKRLDVDYLEMTAGEYKTTLTPMGEITEKGKAKFKEELEEVHQLFKTFISFFRPQVDIEKIATGEHWYGQHAMERHLIDHLITSDDYLLGKRDEAQIYLVEYHAPKTVKEKMAHILTDASDNLVMRWFQRLFVDRTSRM